METLHLDPPPGKTSGHFTVQGSIQRTQNTNLQILVGRLLTGQRVQRLKAIDPDTLVFSSVLGHILQHPYWAASSVQPWPCTDTLVHEPKCCYSPESHDFLTKPGTREMNPGWPGECAFTNETPRTAHRYIDPTSLRSDVKQKRTFNFSPTDKTCLA